jgi:drug/metabolite transporter (DMT)-like permease
LALVGVTAVWGWTFVVVRDAIDTYPVLPFLALRFTLAALVLAPSVIRSRGGFRTGLVPGAALAAGYLAQTAGLRFTTASKAGLLTGLFVVLTPALTFALYRVRARTSTIFVVIAALIGTILLVAPGAAAGGSDEVLGDGLEVLTALCFSIHILLLARYAPGRDAPTMAFSQMVVGSMLFAVGAAATGGFPAPSATVWGAIVITGVLASALAFWVQTTVQQQISSARIAVILTAEPAFATLFGFMLGGDRFGIVQAVGAAIILLAIVAHEVLPGVPPAPLMAGS